jgi:hypothetical protein
MVSLVGIFYHTMVSCLPALFMRIIGQKLNVKSNSILHADKRTYQDRSVVIPCPDFLYSTVNANLTSPATALLFNAPLMVYGSLGLYDDMARCIDIANHSHSPLRALIVGPQVIATNEELQEFHPNTRILRLSSPTGLLLHRFLMPSPENHAELRHQQLTEITCEVVYLPKHLLSSHSLAPPASLPMKFLFSLLWSPATVLLTAPLLASLASLPSQISFPIFFSSGTPLSLSFPALLLLMLLLSLLLALPLLLLTLLLLKKPSFVLRTGIMTLSQIDLWKFNTLEAFGDPPSVTRSHLSELSPARLLDPFRNLVFFLHGALGLTPREVQYGGTLMVHTSPPPPASVLSCARASPPTALETESETGTEAVEYLQYGGCYAIDVPSLSLSCEWWSLTLYGHDLYLLPLPTQLHRYSINSYELCHIHAAVSAAAALCCAPEAMPPIVYRILCSAEDPQLPPLSTLLENLQSYLRSSQSEYSDLKALYLPIAWIPLVPPQGYQPPPPSQQQRQQQQSKLEDTSPRFILRGLIPLPSPALCPTPLPLCPCLCE